jgi:hypothetical protein
MYNTAGLILEKNMNYLTATALLLCSLSTPLFADEHQRCMLMFNDGSMEITDCVVQQTETDIVIIEVDIPGRSTDDWISADNAIVPDIQQ